ncbi:hypothetical protein F4805DRAFT_452793 [Annulohypoxylon moriforme]|nr:hypothetical protein F4805DRAFT_452793 [Annulohypoxylon moriforme]
MSNLEVTSIQLGAILSANFTLDFPQANKLPRKHRVSREDILYIERSLQFYLLLLRIVISLRQSLFESKTQRLLVGPTSPKWQNPEIESTMKKSLDPDRSIFLSNTISELCEMVSSLETSLRVITAWVGSKGLRSIFQGFFIQYSTRGAINRIERQNKNSKEISKYIREIRRQQFTNEIKRRLKIIDKLRMQIRQTLHQWFASDIQMAPKAEALSIYSVESEVGSEGVSLSYLPLSLQKIEEPRGILKEEALLDTGATACAISTDIALQLNLNIKKTEETVVITAVDEEFPVEGQVQLNLRWKDNEVQFGTRMWLYVVHGLTHPILLSHDFTQNHPEVWVIARTAIGFPRQLNVTWFNNPNEKQKKAEEVYRARCLQRNMAIADASKQERLSEQDQLLAGSAQNSMVGSSITSSSGSASGPASGSTSGSSSVSASASTNTANSSGTPATP